MVVFVLHTAGEQAFAFQGVRRAVGVAELHDGLFHTLDVASDTREGQATLGVDFALARRHGYLRIGEQHRHDFLWVYDLAVQGGLKVFVVHVDDEKLQREPDLRRG